ncbi:MAG: DUF2063 domain-containing protein [Rhizobiales bacterium]|nr:DUF2063 domain-containing protein [Hyphomicrobiales bacterium]
MPWLDEQAHFGRAVRDPAAGVPGSVAATRGGRRADKRFAVYRNNHAVGLVDALAARFEVSAQLVGDRFFAAAARAFVAEHIPQSPVLLHYGRGFPSFLAGLPGAEKLPFLAAVAELEWRIGEAYHAADAAPIGVAELGACDPELLTRAALCMHPSLRLIKSEWPVLSIWKAHKTCDVRGALEAISWHGEVGMVIRPRLDVEVIRLAPTAFEFIAALVEGATLDAAAGRAGIAQASELGQLVGFVLQAGVVVGLEGGSSRAAADPEPGVEKTNPR